MRETKTELAEVKAPERPSDEAIQAAVRTAIRFLLQVCSYGQDKAPTDPLAAVWGIDANVELALGYMRPALEFVRWQKEIERAERRRPKPRAKRRAKLRLVKSPPVE